MAGRHEIPVDPGAGPVQRFAFELRKLRAEAGGITYRAMAKQAGYAVTTLSQAAAGEQLPTLPVTVAYAVVCGGDAAEWEARWKQAVEEAAGAGPQDGEGTQPPYRGLARFETGDSGLFFGRDRLTADLLDLLRRNRFAAVFGPSGSGKSSLLRAGLIPALRNSPDPELRPAAIRILTPGNHPALTHGSLLAPDAACGRRADTFVIVDQFEEVFTLCRNGDERAHFIDLLLRARQPESRLRVLLAVRGDFYGRCTEHPHLADALRDANLLAGVMSPAELRDAVVKPAAAAGLTVERALTDRLVKEVTDAPGGLPLLSHVLLETWQRRRGKMLTLAGYEAAGALEGAIAKTAEEVYGRIAGEQAATARRLLLRLVAPGDGTPDTRRPAGRAELETIGGPETTRVLEALARARLLTIDDTSVEIAHEALLTAWPRLRGWIDEDRDALRSLRQVTDAARAWEQLDRDPGALFRGIRLAQATELDRRLLSAVEQTFLDAGLAVETAEDAAVRRRARLRRRTVALLSVLALLATMTAIWAVRAQRTADRQRDVAVSRELAARADALLSQRPEEAMLLALRGFQQAHTVEARSSLLSAYGMYRANRLTGHTGNVEAVAFSPDGRMLASAGDDHSLKLWDTATRQLVATLHGHTAAVTGVAFSPDGRTLATAGTDGSVKLWDPATRQETAMLTGHTGALNAVAFSPDGRTLATAGSDRTVRLWNTRDRRPTVTFAGNTAAVSAVAFSPDGREVAAAGTDGAVQVWDRKSGHAVKLRLTKPVASISNLAFSPNGDILAAADDDGAARLWNVATEQSVAVPDGHGGSVQATAFSPDGRTLATANADGTVKLWDPATRRTTATLTGQAGDVNALVFSPDGLTLATADADGTVRLWSTATRQPIGTLGGKAWAVRAVFSPDGRTLASSFGDGTVRLWDVRRQRETARLAGHDKGALGVAFSPDGRTLATTGADNTVRLWSTATHRQTAVLPGHTNTVLAAAFHPDGRTLATASYDGTVRLWSIAERRTTAVLTGHTDAVLAVAFSSDGRSLATAGADHTARVWSADTHQVTAVLTGHKNAVYAVAFHPDGRTLATASADHTTRMWDIATRHVTTTLTGHNEAVSAVAFSPDGQSLITGSHDHTLRLWNVGTRQTVAVLHGHTGSVGALALSPDGRTLATIASGAEPEQRLWSLDTDYVARLICQDSNTHHWLQLVTDSSTAKAACA